MKLRAKVHRAVNLLDHAERAEEDLTEANIARGVSFGVSLMKAGANVLFVLRCSSWKIIISHGIVPYIFRGVGVMGLKQRF